MSAKEREYQIVGSVALSGVAVSDGIRAIPQAARMDSARAWLAWARAHTATINPFKAPPGMPEVPDDHTLFDSNEIPPGSLTDVFAGRTPTLLKRPYDLRHTCVSTWLHAGAPVTQVAEWAGHSVAVLLRIYAKCLDGQDEAVSMRIENTLAGG